ncbi:MAG: cyclase [Elainella sp. Prado103]|jgi:hypothetical protein|nr:cyclase [Elainella sp. Prado103]
MTLALVDPIDLVGNKADQAALLSHEILLHTRPHSAWGGAVTAQMYLPLERSAVWRQVTHYARWVEYFPSLTQSVLLSSSLSIDQPYQRLYQVASKSLLCFTAQVEIYLKVFEIPGLKRDRIQFEFEQGSFQDFSAELKLQDLHRGTLLTYGVKATPTLPIPTQIIQEGIRLDLPTNMRSMRQVICQG